MMLKVHIKVDLLQIILTIRFFTIRKNGKDFSITP